jgi:hypothetical protein
MGPTVPDALGPLAFLIGTWRGEGFARYPTMQGDVAYQESVSFDHVGEPFLRYVQESWSADDRAPLHFERGFLRPGDDGEIELTLAHPLGLTEIAHGRLSGTELLLTTEPGGVGRTHTGSSVVGVVRRYALEGDVLRYELEMALDEVPMTLHLEAALRRDA